MNVRSQFDCPPQQYFFHKQVGLIITLFNYFCNHFVIYVKRCAQLIPDLLLQICAYGISGKTLIPPPQREKS